jgi:hypothetical protein
MPDPDASHESDAPATGESAPPPEDAPEAAAGVGDGAGDTPPDAESDEPPAFLNRAARRARGKGKGATAPHQAASRGANPPRRGPAQSRRNWTNRRTGG